MARRRFMAMEFKSGEWYGDVPLTTDSPYTQFMQGFGNTTFKLDTNDPRCPPEWRELLTPGKMAILVVDEEYDGDPNPIIKWFGYINATPSTLDTIVSIPCVESLAFLDRSFVGKDYTFDDVDQTLIFKQLVEWSNENGGVNFIVDAPLSGVKRTVIYGDDSDTHTLNAMQELAGIDAGFEFRCEIEWANEERTKINKIIRVGIPTIGNVTTTPDITITEDAIINVSTSNAITDGNFATYVIATGAGTGAKRVRSAPITDTARESQGFPRIEVRRNFSHITTQEEIDEQGKALAKTLFARRDIVTITLPLHGVYGPSEFEWGSTVMLDIHKGGASVDGPWRVIAKSVDEKAGTWEPTFALIGVKAKDFPKAIDPSDYARDKNDLNQSLEDIRASDPYATGKDWTFDDGSTFGIDPTDGLSYKDAFGNDMGFGGGGVTKGVVISYNSSNRLANVETVNGRAVYDNGQDLDLQTGLVVYVADNTETDKPPAVISVATSQPSQPNMFGPFGSYYGFPVDASSKLRNLPVGMSFVDYDNIYARGNDTLVIDAEPGLIFFSSNGVKTIVPAPTGYKWAERSINLYAGKAVHWFIGGPFNVPRPFLYNTTFGGFETIPGLPAAQDARNTGVWGSQSYSRELRSQPTLFIARITGTEYSTDLTTGKRYANLIANFMTLDPVSKTWSTSPDVAFESGKYTETRHGKEYFPDERPANMSLYCNNGHIYFSSATYSIGTGPSGYFRETVGRMHYYNGTTGDHNSYPIGIIDVEGSPNRLDESSWRFVHAKYLDSIRISPNGTALYITRAEEVSIFDPLMGQWATQFSPKKLISRQCAVSNGELFSSSEVRPLSEQIPDGLVFDGEAYLQFENNSEILVNNNIYFVTQLQGEVISDDSTSGWWGEYNNVKYGPPRAGFYMINLFSNKMSQIIGPQYEVSGGSAARISMPTESTDGTIVVNFENSNEDRTRYSIGGSYVLGGNASHKIHRIVNGAADGVTPYIPIDPQYAVEYDPAKPFLIPVDENGVPIIPTDSSSGEPMYTIDANGKPVIPTNDTGEPLFRIDQYGNILIDLDLQQP